MATNDDRRTPNTGNKFSRRTLLKASGAAAALPVVSAQEVSATAHAAGTDSKPTATALLTPRDERWTNYYGAVRVKTDWGNTRREREVDVLDAALVDHDVIIGIAGWGNALSGSVGDLTTYMEAVEKSEGDSARRKTIERAEMVIDKHSGDDVPHKVVAGQLGNEINSSRISARFRDWARETDHDYPHPRSNFPDDPRGPHDRGYIGYFAEYFLAPAIVGRRQANQAAAPADRIPLMLGSIAGARHPYARRWASLLLNYKFSGEFAPSLVGKRVRSVIDLLSIHYLLTADPLNDEDRNQWRNSLGFYHNWIGIGRIKGVWHTEEGGNRAKAAGKHASVSQRVFARSMDWAFTHDASSDVMRLCGFFLGGQTPPEGTSYQEGMNTLHDFLGHNAQLVNRSGDVSANVNNTAHETYGFETENGARRVLFVTPVYMSRADQGETLVRSVTMRPADWTAGVGKINAKAHLFRTGSGGHRNPGVSVSRNQDGSYTITPAQPIDLNNDSGGATLSIHLTNQSL